MGIISIALYSLLAYVLYQIFMILVVPSVRQFILHKKFGEKITTNSPLLFIKFILNPKMQVDKEDQAEPFMRRPIRENPNSHATLFTMGMRKLFYMLNDPATIKDLLLNHNEKYKRNVGIQYQDLLFEKGIINQSGEKARKQRALIHPFFTFDAMRARVGEMNASATRLVKALRESGADTGAGNSVDTSKLLIRLQRTTGDVICASFFGEDVVAMRLNGQSVSEELASILKDMIQPNKNTRWAILRSIFISSDKSSRMPEWLLTAEEKALKKRVVALNALINGVVDARRAHFDENEGKNTDFVQAYLRAQRQDPSSITQDEIVHQFLTFYFAGMDTTAHLILALLFVLAKYEDVYAKVRAEVASVFGDANAAGAHACSHEQANHLHYLGVVIKETLRRYSPVGSMIVREVREAHQLGIFSVSEKDALTVNLLGLMTDPKYFGEDAMQFKPERWLDKDYQPNTYAYIPFSAGPRNCIGQHMALLEAKIIATHILRNFNIKLREGAEPFWEQNIMYTLKDSSIIQLECIN